MERVSPTPLIQQPPEKPASDRQADASRRQMIRRVMLGAPLILSLSARSAFAKKDKNGIGGAANGSGYTS